MKPLLIALSALLLAACANRPVTDRATVEMLPQSIAKDIVARKLGANWAAAPYVVKSGSCVPNEFNVPITYRDIKGILYNPTLGRVFVMKEPSVYNPSLFSSYSCNERISFPADAAAASEISTALRALGACTSSQSFAC